MTNQNEIKVITKELIEKAREEKKKVQMGRKGTKNEGFVRIDGEQYKIVDKMPEPIEKPKQIHESRDRDIKIESGKVGDINVKLIYHRMTKDNSKQYRIFLSKKIDGKLKRTRLVNDEIKAIQTDEKKMLEYYKKIIDRKVKIQVS